MVNLPVLGVGVLRFDTVIVAVEQIIIDLDIRVPGIPVAILSQKYTLHEPVGENVVANDQTVTTLLLQGIRMIVIMGVDVVPFQQNVIAPQYRLDRILPVVVYLTIPDDQAVGAGRAYPEDVTPVRVRRIVVNMQILERHIIAPVRHFDPGPGVPRDLEPVAAHPSTMTYGRPM